VLSRDRPGTSTTGGAVWAWAAGAGLAVLGALVVATFRDYGLSWDEEHSAENGLYALRWLATWGRDTRVITGFNQHLYGSFYNVLVQVAAAVSPFGLYPTDHLLSAAFGWLGVLFTYRLGSIVGGARCGFFSALFLALTPAYYGHSFMNSKDVPLAALFVASAYHLIRGLDELPQLARGTVFWLAIVTGCAMGVRVVAILLLVYWAMLLAGWWLSAPAAERGQLAGRTALGWWWKPALAAWVIMVAFWPYAQLNPLLNPFRALRDNARTRPAAAAACASRAVEIAPVCPGWECVMQRAAVGREARLCIRGRGWMSSCLTSRRSTSSVSK
jgi:hypothetical protein